MTEDQLMANVQAKAGRYLASLEPTTKVPVAFFAALTANESGGNPNASRFEPGIYNHLVAVSSGAKPNYGSITTARLAGMDEATLRDLSTSWCFTQVMGYHCLEWGQALDYIKNPESHFKAANRLLMGFVRQFGLDPTSSFEAMSRCWNTGRPGGETFDPNYVANILHRMIIWNALPQVSYVTGSAETE